MGRLASTLWLVALIAATAGYAAGASVFQRGVVYGDPGPALPDLDLPRRAINTQLELEPDLEAVQRSLRLIRAAGFGIVRQQFAWSALEVGGKGQFFDYDRGRPTWARYDEMVRLARQEGLEVLARLDLPPDWSRPPDSYKTHPPSNVQDYADFVAAFVEHYRGQVRYVQLWNEPNLNEEWGRRPVDPAGYVELLRAGYLGAKRADPAVRVVSGELAQTLEPDLPHAAGLDDLLYLDRMYLHGAQPYFDVLAANAYGLRTGPGDRKIGPEFANFPRVLLTREVMRRHGDLGKAVWVTEFGWNALPAQWSGDPSPWGHVSPRAQAQHTLAAYERAAVEWPWLGPMALWLFRRPGADPRDPTPYFALVDDRWQPRPAYEALAATAGAQALGVGIHQESSPGLRFDGVWQWTPDASASLGGIRESPVSGASLRLRFRGTRADVMAPVGPSRGTAYVKVNGAYTLANRLPLNANGQAVVDFFAPEPRAQQRITLADGLPDRWHDLELVVTGQRSAAATGVGVGIDAVVISRARPTLAIAALALAWAATAAGVAWRQRRWVVRSLLYPLLWRLRGARLLAPASGAVDLSRGPAPTALPALVLGVLFALPWRRIAVLLVVASLPLAPVTVATPAGRYSPVELLALACVALHVACAYLSDQAPVRRGAFWGPALLLVLGGLLSLAVAAYPRLALRELRLFIVEPVLFYVVARSVLHGPRDALHVAGAFAAGAGMVSLLAVTQTVTGQGLVAAEGVARAAALYGSPNNLALLLDRALPLCAALALYGRGAASRYHGLVAALCALALVFTFSRGAWVAAALALSAVAAPRLAAIAPAYRRRLLVAGVATLVPLLAVGLGLALQVERFRSVFAATGTGVLRFHLWGAALSMALDHPIAGVGLDQFLYHYPRYMHPEAWREPNLSHPHNVLLDFWLRLGLLGLAAAGWSAWLFGQRVVRPYWAAVRLRWQGSAAPGPDRPLIVGVAGAAVALLVHGLLDNSYFVLDLAYATWTLLLVAELATEDDG